MNTQFYPSDDIDSLLHDECEGVTAMWRDVCIDQLEQKYNEMIGGVEEPVAEVVSTVAFELAQLMRDRAVDKCDDKTLFMDILPKLRMAESFGHAEASHEMRNDGFDFIWGKYQESA